MSVTAFVALGSNLGDRKAHLEDAIGRLHRSPEVTVVKRSGFLENAAVGGPEGSPPFLNAVVEVTTTLDAHALLAVLLDIERQIGRVRRAKWEPRVIDLDLILYGDETIDTPTLKVPHPLMLQRDFVMNPLREIAPQVATRSQQPTRTGRT